MTSKMLASKTVEAKMKPCLSDNDMRRIGRNFQIAIVVVTLLSLFLTLK